MSSHYKGHINIHVLIKLTCLLGVDPDAPNGSKASSFLLLLLVLLEENALPKGSELENGSSCWNRNRDDRS